MWESTGLYGESALCRYQLGAGQVEQRAALAAELFGEGICRFDDVIWQLTWQDRIALRWDAAHARADRPGAIQPRGLGHLRRRRIRRDQRRKQRTRPARTVDPGPARGDPRPLRGPPGARPERSRLVGGHDLGQRGGTHYLAGIDPDSGEVTDIVNARAAAERHLGQPQAIMNGIAALPAAGEFLLTGKGWRSIRHVRLKPAREGASQRRLLAGLSH